MRYPPLKQYLARRRRRRWGVAGAVLLLAAALSWADHHGKLLYHSDRLRYHGGSFTVKRVVDGDTLVIDAPDGEAATTRVRLWGIDTPELARTDPPRDAEPLAAEAKAMLAALCEGRSVTLHLEAHRERDVYGRILAHVQLPDGTMASERLLSAGLARYDSRWSHARVERHALLERQARSDKAGIWGAQK